MLVILGVFERKVSTSFDELADLGVTNPVLVVLNKMDLISEQEIISKQDFVKVYCAGKTFDIVSISVAEKIHLNKVVNKIFELLPQLYRLRFKLPNDEQTQSFLSWMFDYAQLEDIRYREKVHICITTHEQIKDKIISKINTLHGAIIEVKQV